MQKTVGACFDHVGFATPDKPKAVHTLRTLGFAAGNTDSDRHFHVMMDNCYFEALELTPDYGKIDAAKLYIILFSAKKADKMRAAFADNGYEVSPMGQSGRHANHGAQTGFATFRSFQLKNAAPFLTDPIFAAVQHMTPHLIYQDKRLLHPNGTCRVTSYVFHSQKVEEDAAALSKMDLIARPFADAGHYVECARFVCPHCYEAEFGQPCPEKPFGLAAMSFSGGHHDYLKAQADSLGLKYFYVSEKLYIDVTAEVGCFFIFE